MPPPFHDEFCDRLDTDGAHLLHLLRSDSSDSELQQQCRAIVESYLWNDETKFGPLCPHHLDSDGWSLGAVPMPFDYSPDRFHVKPVVSLLLGVIRPRQSGRELQLLLRRLDDSLDLYLASRGVKLSSAELPPDPGHEFWDNASKNQKAMMRYLLKNGQKVRARGFETAPGHFDVGSPSDGTVKRALNRLNKTLEGTTNYWWVEWTTPLDAPDAEIKLVWPGHD